LFTVRRFYRASPRATMHSAILLYYFCLLSVCPCWYSIETVVLIVKLLTIWYDHHSSSLSRTARETPLACTRGRKSYVSWRRSIVVRTLVSAGELSLSCARLLAGWLTTLWLSRPLSVSQHGQLSKLRGR